jgi:hypothetical protein
MKMKNRPFARIVLVMAVLLGIVMPATIALSFDFSTHSCIAKAAIEKCWLCRYHAGLGGPTPDIAWWLLLRGYIGSEEAECIHNRAFNEDPPKSLTWRNYRLWYFRHGYRTHVYADRVADDYIDQWIGELPEEAVEKLHEEVGEEQAKRVLGLVFDFSIGALVVDWKGLQAWDYVFVNWHARYVEEKIEEKCRLGDVGFDISWEFKKWVRVSRILEKFAKIYALFLKAEIGERFLYNTDELLAVERELFNEGLEDYLMALAILLNYPTEIYRIIEHDWQTAVEEAIRDCTDFSP